MSIGNLPKIATNLLTCANMRIDFPIWLAAEMERQGMTQADLARASGLSPAAVSLILSSGRGVGVDAAQAISRALKMAPENVYRAAGILPSKTKNQADIDDLAHKFDLLSDSQKGQLLDYADFLLMRTYKTQAIEIKPIEDMTDDELVEATRKALSLLGLDPEKLDRAALIKLYPRRSRSTPDRKL